MLFLKVREKVKTDPAKKEKREIKYIRKLFKSSIRKVRLKISLANLNTSV